MDLITLSRETLALLGSPSKAKYEAVMALIAPIEFLSIHGICTKPPIGSQVKPRWCSIAISAAIKTCPGLPPEISVKAAAAIADDTPTSAWQPPMAAEMVAFFLNKVPISPAVSIKRMTSSSLLSSVKVCAYINTAGITPLAPLVGAVIILPKAAFSSLTAKAKQLTHLVIELKLFSSAQTNLNHSSRFL